MKSLVFAAFALSLVLAVSAQCDVNAVLTCVQDYTNMISGTTDPGEITRLTRQFCQGTCVKNTLPACSSLDPAAKAGVDQIMQACSLLNGGPPSAGYSVFALLSSIILAGVAAVFY